MSKFADLYGKKPAPGMRVPPEPLPEDAGELAADPNVYTGYITSRGGRPAMGFYIAYKTAEGFTQYGFMYHGLNHPKFQVVNGEELLRFTYSGMGVTISGTGLQRIFEALMDHTLKAILEYDGRPKKADAPVITGISIKQAPPARTDNLELVIGGRQAG